MKKSRNESPFIEFMDEKGFVSPRLFDSIETDRPITYDLLGKLTRKWRVIYADPPWKFENRSELGEERNANQHYDTMSIQDIMSMPVKDIAEDDAVLIMWVTDPTLHQAMDVIKAWGFEYKTVLFYWVKTWDHVDLECMHETKSFPIGTGYVTRAGPEMVLIATRGKPERRILNIDGVMKQDKSIRRLQFAPRGKHSEKPKKFYGLIERLYDGPYLELFTRTRRPGWGAWGNQVGGLDDGTAGKKKKFVKPVAPAPLFDED